MDLRQRLTRTLVLVVLAAAVLTAPVFLLAARLLVFGLLALVGALAWTNNESVHVNVVNFVLVTVLAAALLDGGELLLVAVPNACLMVAIAWRQAAPAAVEELTEARVESIVQLLPTYCVIVLVLWLKRRAATRASPQAHDRSPAP